MSRRFGKGKRETRERESKRSGKVEEGEQEKITFGPEREESNANKSVLGTRKEERERKRASW